MRKRRGRGRREEAVKGVKKKEKEGQRREEGGLREEKGRYTRGKEESKARRENTEERWLGGRRKGRGRGGQ